MVFTTQFARRVRRDRYDDRGADPYTGKRVDRMKCGDLPDIASERRKYRLDDSQEKPAVSKSRSVFVPGEPPRLALGREWLPS
jgi:hypothetical protein